MKKLILSMSIVGCLVVLSVYGKRAEAKPNDLQEKTECKEERLTAEASSCSTIHAGHNYVDLGLSVMWASHNVGVPNKSVEREDYYAWGEILPKQEYTLQNCLTYNKELGDIGSNPNYDVARANWGGQWRLPTNKEMEELVNQCVWEWTTQDVYKGYRVTGKNGNSIFLPAVGICEYSGIIGFNECGYYWCSTPFEEVPNTAYMLEISSHKREVSWAFCSIGGNVRAVVKL